MKYAKIVVVPCQLDDEGKVIVTHHTRTPYAYHHILGVHKDKSCWPLAHIDSRIPHHKLGKIARIISDGEPIESDPNYYEKLDSI